MLRSFRLSARGGRRRRVVEVLNTFRAASPRSEMKADVAIVEVGIRCGVGHHIHLRVAVVLKNDVAPLVPELDATAVERDEHRLSGSDRHVDWCDPAVLSTRRQLVSVCAAVERLARTTISRPASAPLGLMRARSM